MQYLQWEQVKPVELVDLDENSRDRIAEGIIRKYDRWKTERRGYEDVWREIDRHVNQYDPNYTPDQRTESTGFQLKIQGGLGSKLKMTNVFAHREGIVAAMMKFLMENDYDFFDIDPLDPLNDDAVEAVKQYMIWVFSLMDFESAFVPFCRDIVQYGIAVAAYEWRREVMPRWRKDIMRDPISGDLHVAQYEAQEVVYDAPKFTPLDIYYTVVDPTAENLQTATLIFKKPVTAYEILANQNYQGLDWNFVSGCPDFGQGTDSVLEKDKKMTQGDATFQSGIAYDGKKEVMECWGDIEDGETVYKNYVAEVLNHKLIRFEPNPYIMPHKPFVIARYTSETGRVYGRSPLASITGIQAAFDTTVNQYVDYWNMQINRPIVVQANTIVRNAKDDRTKLPPISKDAVWTVRDTKGISRLNWDQNAVDPNPTAILAMLDQQMDRATGDNVLGSGGTAQPYVKTGVAMAAADAGSAKLNMYAKTIEKEAILPVLNMTIDLLRQMVTDPKTFPNKSMPGAQPLTFNPADLLSDIKFSMRGASYNMTKQLQVSNLQQFLQGFFTNPVTAQVLNPIMAVKIMGEAMGIRNVMQLLNPKAAQMLQMMPPVQPTFDQKVQGFFSALNPFKRPELQGPQGQLANPVNNTMENTNEPQQFGQQYTDGAAAAFGGNTQFSQAPAAFNYVPQG